MALSKIDVANMLTGATPVANGGTAATTFASAGLGKRPNAKPLIINGDMAVAQRGTSFTGVSSGANFTADRFQFYLANLGTYTLIQEALTSGNAYDAGFKTAWRIDTTTADASPSAADYAILRYKFEGQDLQSIKKGTSNAQKLTLAFWVKSNKATTGSLDLFDYDNSRIVGATYTVNTANTWEKKIINIAADTTGAFANDNGLSLGIEWFLDTGSNTQGGTTPTAWESQTNTNRNVSNFALGDNTANDWAITGVQLEVGEYTSSTLPPFQHESFGDNLARCQRYFQMRAEGNQKIISIAHWGSGSEVDFIMQIPFMRTQPSIEYTTGSEYWAIGGSGGSTNTLDNLNMNSWSTEMNINLWTTTGAGGTAGYAYYGYTNNASAKLGFTAEL